MDLTFIRSIQSKPAIASSALMILIFLILSIFWIEKITGSEITKDARQNLTMAYNFYKHGTLSLSEDGEDLKPSNYREPVPNIFLGAYIYINPFITKDLIIEDLTAGKFAKILKYSNIFWASLVFFLSYYLAFIITKRWLIGILAASIIGIVYIPENLDDLYTELQGASFILLCAILLYQASQKSKLSCYILLGFFFALLILTKASFFYISILLVLFVLAYLLFLHKERARTITVKMVALSAVCAALVVPWMARNYVHFGAFEVTQRGGVVLLIRAYKDLMTTTEFWGTFYAWAPAGPLAKTAAVLLGYRSKDLMEGGRLERLNRKLDISYYRTARRERTRLEREFEEQGVSNPSHLADRELKRMALEIIKQHPLDHAVMTIPFFWRGMGAGTIDVIFFLSFMYLTLYAVIQRRFDLLSFLFIPLSMVIFNAVLSHNIPRYNQPALPEMVVSFLIIALPALDSAWSRLAAHFKELPTG